MIGVRGIDSYVVQEKLKSHKAKLRIWNIKVFGRVEERKKDVLKKVAHWKKDVIESQRPFTLIESEEKVVALEAFKSWSLAEETFWRQKSREIWFKEGDRNMGYFY